MLLVMVYITVTRVFTGHFTNQLHVNTEQNPWISLSTYASPGLHCFSGKCWKSFYFISYVSIIYPQILHTLKYARCHEFVLFLLLSFLTLYSRLSSLPEAPAAIDWSYYRSTVANAGMVDEFEKKVNLITQNYFTKQKRDAVSLFKTLTAKVCGYI